MKKRMMMLSLGLLLLSVSTKAQWAVFDPANLAQGIVNTTKQIVQTSSTASNMLKSFNETVKITSRGGSITMP